MNKFSFVVVMENGRLVNWTGTADDESHGEGLAIDYASHKYGCQVFDICHRPIINGSSSICTNYGRGA